MAEKKVHNSSGKEESTTCCFQSTGSHRSISNKSRSSKFSFFFVVIAISFILLIKPTEAKEKEKEDQNEDKKKAISTPEPKKNSINDDFLNVVKLIGDATKNLQAARNFQDDSEGDSESEDEEEEEKSESSGDSEKATAVVTGPLIKNDPILRFAEDLTEKAREGRIDPVLGREEEIERITEILARRGKGNPILVGEAGVGKTAVVEGLALRIVEGTVPSALQQRSILSLQISSLIAGASFRGDFEKRFKTIIDRVLSSNGSIIIFIDEIHVVMGAGKSDGPLDFANMLKPALARTGFKVIAATTHREFRKFIEPDPAFVRRFVPVTISAPSVENAIIILDGGKIPYEEFHKVKITHEAVVAAAKLSEEYIPDRQLPDKAFDLLDTACSSKLLRLENQRTTERRAKLLRGEKISEGDYVRPEHVEIDENDIAMAVSKWTGIPVTKLEESERGRILQLGDNLRKRVIGQDKAIDAVCDAVLRNFAGLARTDQPVGSFLFLGSTGVGKTELAKALAEELWQDKRNHLVRIDMSEFQEAHSVSRLIGSPPGYAGNDEGGQLTEAVRQVPNSVVLFDEIERAHKNIFDLFLQILGEGRLTDGRGKTVDFTKAIIIFTSNMGQKHIIDADTEARAQNQDDNKSKGGVNSIGSGKKEKTPVRKPGWKNKGKGDSARLQDLQSKVMQDVEKVLKTEIINRITQVVIFNPISEETLKLVLGKEVEVLKNVIRAKGIDFDVNAEAVDFIISNAHSPKYGARPLKRFFEKNVLAPLSKLLVSGDVPENSCVVVVTGTKKNTLELEVAPRNVSTRKCDLRRVKIIFLARVAPGNPDDPDQAVWQ